MLGASSRQGRQFCPAYKALALIVIAVFCGAAGAAETPEELSKATDVEVCGLAIDLSKNDWDMSYGSRVWLAEAHKRKIGVSTCLELLGKPVEDSSNAELCQQALDPAQSGWDLSHSHRAWITEAEKRRLSVADCRDLLGVSMQDVTRASNLDLCKHALNETGDDWNASFQNKFRLNEIGKRHLSVKDCTVLLIARGAAPQPADALSNYPSSERRTGIEIGIAGNCYTETRSDKLFAKHSDDVLSEFCTCSAKRFVDNLSDEQITVVASLDTDQAKEWLAKAKNASKLTSAFDTCGRRHLQAGTKPASVTPQKKKKKQQKKKKP